MRSRVSKVSGRLSQTQGGSPLLAQIQEAGNTEERCREIYMATGGCANDFINREDLAMLEDIYRS